MGVRNIVGRLVSLGHVLRALAARRESYDRLCREHEGLRIGEYVEIRSLERLRLGRRVSIDSGALLHCGGMSWSHGRGGISLGDDAYVGPNSVLFGAGGITVGARVLISPAVVIASHQHGFAQADVRILDQPTEFAAVDIEDDVWIGSNATVLPGVRIGAGSVVGAGAVVSRDIPPRSIALGVPARVWRSR